MGYTPGVPQQCPALVQPALSEPDLKRFLKTQTLLHWGNSEKFPTRMLVQMYFAGLELSILPNGLDQTTAAQADIAGTPLLEEFFSKELQCCETYDLLCRKPDKLLPVG